MAARNKPTNNLPINYEDQLSREAAEIAKRLNAPSGDRIRYLGNRGFTTPDGNEGTEIECVIVDFVTANLYYDAAFDSSNPRPPACFAIGPEPKFLVPSPNSPAKQADSCNECPYNQYGTATTGRGKACKNTRLLALVSSTVFDDPDNTSIWILAVPPASLKAFDRYASTISSKHGIIPVGVLTAIKPNVEVSYASPQFELVRKLTAEELAVVMPLRNAANERLIAEPDTSQYEPPAPVRSGKPTRR